MDLVSAACGGSLKPEMLETASQQDLMKILSSLAADQSHSRESDAAVGMIALAGYKMKVDHSIAPSAVHSPTATGTMSPLELVATLAVA
ncbi:hypothetical protein HDU67_003626, partial [Dinochytrium kinnereticum]